MMVGLSQVAGAVGGALTGGVQAQPAAPFSGVLKSMVEQSNALDEKAKDAVTGVLNGSGVDVHDAMIAGQKADMAFELTMQVRNKAVSAYQTMMQMQF